MKKYYVLILLGYQSIHDIFEPAHEKFILIAYILDKKESARCESVVERLNRDQEAAGSSLTGVTVLWSLSKTHLP